MRTSFGSRGAYPMVGFDQAHLLHRLVKVVKEAAVLAAKYVKYKCALPILHDADVVVAASPI